jgi:hypothetical protein
MTDDLELRCAFARRHREPGYRFGFAVGHDFTARLRFAKAHPLSGRRVRTVPVPQA